MTKKFKTLPKIQTLQLVRNANRILLNIYEAKNSDFYEYEEEATIKDLHILTDNYEASEFALSQYLNQ